MSNLAPGILNLVARLSSPDEHRTASSPLLDPEAMEEAYHQALRRWFELTAQGETADLAEVDQIHQELVRLMDEVGEPRATALRRHWAKDWHERTGVCAWCGEAGPYHDPTLGDEEK